MSKANFKRWVFNLFRKLVMPETVRKLAGRKCHVAGPDSGERKCALWIYTQSRCDVARRIWVRTQNRTCHSGNGRLHDVKQVTWTLRDSDVAYQSAELVSYSEANW